MIDLSTANITDLLNALFQKINEIFHISIDKIDWANITGTIITIASISFITLFILWLLRAIGLYTMAKNKGDDTAFLAFIPYFCFYVEGKIVGKTKIFGIEISKPELLLPLLLIAKFLPFVGPFASILFIVFSFAILYRIYQIYCPNLAIIFLILSIIFPILQPFFLFFIRNNNTNQNKQNA